jgi:CheY-like chemotaxis protein
MMAQRIKVLVVEDDDQVRKMLADLLTAAGYLVQTAADGLHAIGRRPDRFHGAALLRRPFRTQG